MQPSQLDHQHHIKERKKKKKEGEEEKTKMGREIK